MKESMINQILAAILAAIAITALVAVFLSHTQHIITLAICSGLASLLAGEAKRSQIHDNFKTIRNESIQRI